MTSRNLYSIFITGYLLCSVFAARAQVTVKATADRSAILIGEQVRLTLQVAIPEDQPIRFFQVDSIPHFEVLKKEKTDTINTATGTELSQLIHITSFDSGHWVIPSFVLHGDIATDTLSIDVGFSSFDPKQPYHDIKDIVEAEPEEAKKKMWWWYIAGAALLVLLAAVVLVRKKKPVAIMAPPPDPYQTAMEALEQLRNSPADTRQYYSRLIDIFRIYIHSRKGLHSLQKTTDELVIKLRDLGLPKDEFDRLAGALRLGDFVKFARYVPAPEDDRAAFEEIQQSIRRIQQLQ